MLSPETAISAEAFTNADEHGAVVHVRAHFSDDTGQSGTGFVFHVAGRQAHVLTARHVLHDKEIPAQRFTAGTFSQPCIGAILVYFPGGGVDVGSIRFPCGYCKPLTLNPSPSDILTSRDSNIYPYEILKGIEVLTFGYADKDTYRTAYGYNVAAKLRDTLSEASIEHTIYLNPGASGSPLLNLSGYVIGMSLAYHESGKSNAHYLDGADPLIRNILQRAIDANQ